VVVFICRSLEITSRQIPITAAVSKFPALCHCLSRFSCYGSFLPVYKLRSTSWYIYKDILWKAYIHLKFPAAPAIRKCLCPLPPFGWVLWDCPRKATFFHVYWSNLLVNARPPRRKNKWLLAYLLQVHIKPTCLYSRGHVLPCIVWRWVTMLNFIEKVACELRALIHYRPGYRRLYLQYLGHHNYLVSEKKYHVVGRWADTVLGLFSWSMMSSFFKDVDNINITGGFFNASQPQHNGKWTLVDEHRHWQAISARSEGSAAQYCQCVSQLHWLWTSRVLPRYWRGDHEGPF